MSAVHRVKIAARLRPKLQGELVDESVKVCHASDDSTGSSSSSSAASFISVVNPRDATQLFKFPFTSCYDQFSTQDQIFRNDVEPLIDVVYSGVTVTIFAYGVTSSGKTHTMQGTKADPGVIPRVVRAMFEKMPTQQYTTSLSLSYMEIYKDEVYDLLVSRDNAPKLPVRENDLGMVFVANLTTVSISSVHEFDAIYQQATGNRSVGSTNLNRASSRSHAVLTLEAQMLDPVSHTTLTGKINLVDLAGSENNKLTGNDPSRMAESAAINKSLSVLGQVVHALNQGASRIPYRNSKLTRILQDALGGSSVGLLICNLAPGLKFRQDTLNTLNFAVRTKNVENKPVVNERDNRPVPKPHFAALAIQPPASKPAAALLQAISSNAVVASVPSRSRPSLVPRASRASSFGVGAGFQPFAVTGRMTFALNEKIPEEANNSGNLGFGLSEKEIDERISRAVEIEVARRLSERERDREQEEVNRHTKDQEEQESRSIRRRSKSPSHDHTHSAGAVTPMLRRHKVLDDELKSRLEDLEKKFERGNKESQLADVLSPVSKKKTGRAYVALARAHSEKGDLQVALDLYRKAESYVPDNVKLKERIIEIEWAVNNNREFIPSPKPTKKSKGRKKKAAQQQEQLLNVQMEEVNHHRGSGAEFGMELTNTGTPVHSKRSGVECEGGTWDSQTQKRLKISISDKI